MALKKLCRRCGRIIDYGQTYCPDCEGKRSKEITDSDRSYDKNARSKRSIAFYKSPAWIKTRYYILTKYKGLDLYAYYIDKKIVHANTVHHIIELEEDWTRRLDVSNLFPLSSGNHNKIGLMYKTDKAGTQQLLFDLLDKWKKAYS